MYLAVKMSGEDIGETWKKQSPFCTVVDIIARSVTSHSWVHTQAEVAGSAQGFALGRCMRPVSSCQPQAQGEGACPGHMKGQEGLMLSRELGSF